MVECGNVSWLPPLGDKSHWGGACAQSKTASAVRSTAWDKVLSPGPLAWLADKESHAWFPSRSQLPHYHCLCVNKGWGLSVLTELGKRETGSYWHPAQASKHTAILCIFLYIWGGVLFEVIFNICVFTQRPVLYIAHLFMLSCCARSPLSRRSTFLTNFVIVLPQLLLVKGIAALYWICSSLYIKQFWKEFS